MAVKIRLARRGRKKLAMYDIVVADSKAPRDGKFIEKIGTYNPNTNPATINLKEEVAFKWVMVGAQPTETVKAMLSYKGLLFKKHLQIGVNKGAITQEVADARLAEWTEAKTSKIAGKVDKLASKKDATVKAKFEAEQKVNAARAEAIVKKNTVVEEVAEVAAPEAEVEVSENAVEAVVENTPEVAADEVAETAVAEVAEVQEVVAEQEVAVEEVVAQEEIVAQEVSTDVVAEAPEATPEA
jgi:small subunit ribosomal protein S16